MKVDDDQSTESNGVHIRGRNLSAQVDWNQGSGDSRGGSLSKLDSLGRISLEPSRASGLSAELEVKATAVVSDVTTGSRGRGGSGDEGELVIELGTESDNERRLVLVEENGQLGWFLPEQGTDHVDLATVSDGGNRSLTSAIRRQVRVLALKSAGRLLEKGTNAAVGALEKRLNPAGLRSWTPSDFRIAKTGPPDLSAMTAGRSLLVVHGFMGSIHGSFKFETKTVRTLTSAYGNRTMAYNHPTLSLTPKQNAEDLLDQLLDQLGKGSLEVDILAHSRGGLVAREFAKAVEEATNISVRSIVFVATPNAGTPLADPEKPAGLLDAVTNMIDLVPGSDGFAMVMELVADIVFRGAVQGLPGLTAMTPGEEYIKTLNATPLSEKIHLRSIAAEYEPAANGGFLQAKMDSALDLYFGQLRNDRVVPTSSTHALADKFQILPGDRLVLDGSHGVDHSSFWKHPRATCQLATWLSADEDYDKTPKIPEKETDPLVEVAQISKTTSVASLLNSVKSMPTATYQQFENIFGGSANPPAYEAADVQERDVAIVLPGIMGSHLAVDDQTIWVDAWRLPGGGISQLKYYSEGQDGPEPGQPPPKVTAIGLNKTYAPLVATLADKWDVRLFPFDWRDDIFRSAARLAELVRSIREEKPGRGINFVAHSMGGLVARAFVADHKAEWADLKQTEDGPPSGRLVMLGTPNRGSYSIPMTLLGQELAVRGLAAIDIKTDLSELVKIVAGFPGVYQMLPRPVGLDDDWKKLYQAETWDEGVPIDANLLDLACESHKRLEADGIDAERFHYIAGYNKDTPFRVQVKNDKPLRIGQFAMGDGRVAHDLGELPGVPNYFVDATHGGLVQDEHVLSMINTLIETGEFAYTDQILAKAPPRRGSGRDEVVFLDVDRVDRRPLPLAGGPTRGAGGSTNRRPSVHDANRVMDDALSMLLGGGAQPGSRTRLDVKVVHASLEQTNYPVAVGHYAKLPPAGAEGFLSRQLDDALHHRYNLGLGADRAGEVMVTTTAPGARPGGAVVIGLGDFGLLTKSLLSEGIAAGVLELARRRTESETDPSEKFGLASVLIGTPGRYSLTHDESMSAIVEGVIRAITRLGADAPPKFELELIEFYQQKADAAATALASLESQMDRSITDGVELNLSTRVVSRAGGRLGAPSYDESERGWIRMYAELVKPPAGWSSNSGQNDPEPHVHESPSGSSTADSDEDSCSEGDKSTAVKHATKPTAIKRINVSILERRAQVDRAESAVDLAKIVDYVGHAAASRKGDGVGRTLFELLLPHRVKMQLGRAENMHLLVDEQLGQLPWELLSARSDGGSTRSFAQQAGFLRQLLSDEPVREHSVRPEGLQALVIGDPPTKLPRLHGARAEARSVSSMLQTNGWDVSELVYDGDSASGADTDTGDNDSWMEMEKHLHAAPYRLVHIAAHGLFDEKDPHRSGVVTGRAPHHRLSALDFQQMSVQPDLVFLNCCHLGRLDDPSDSNRLASWSDPAFRQPHRFASTVARQLLSNGVRALVVAGWEVDDHAAHAFASVLYQNLLNREPFGDAVLEARRAAFDADGGRSNTWGAYQCWGDPDFQLVVGSPQRRSSQPIASTDQLIRNIQIVQTDAGQARSSQRIEELELRLQTTLTEAGDLAQGSRVDLALGDAYKALGRFDEAARAYHRSYKSSDGRSEFRAIEQWANMAVRSYDESPTTSSYGLDVFPRALDEIEKLIALAGETPERYSIKGSIYKKWAKLLAEKRVKNSERPKKFADLTVDEALGKAIKAYESAKDLSQQEKGRIDLYSGNIVEQLKARDGRGSSNEANRLVKAAEKVAKDPTSFWDRSSYGDSLLTAALVDKEKWTDRADEVAKVYTEAFDSRSAVNERKSVQTHLEELRAIYPRRRGRSIVDHILKELEDYT